VPLRKEDAGVYQGRVSRGAETLFAREHVVRIREVAEKRCDELDTLDAAYAEIYRDHPFQDSPDFVASLRALIERADFKSALDA
jgi:hypothetical protein